MFDTQRFITLPKDGIRALDAETRSALVNFPPASSVGSPMESVLESASDESLSVIDPINDDSAKLVNMTAEAAERTNSSSAPVRAVPVVYYDRPVPRPMPVEAASISLSSAFVDVQIECLDAVSGSPAENARVVAFTDCPIRRPCRAMARYVLLKRGETQTAREISEIVENPSITVLDNGPHHMFLIETSSEAIGEIRAALPDWTIGIEKFYRPPGRPRVCSGLPDDSGD